MSAAVAQPLRQPVVLPPIKVHAIQINRLINDNGMLHYEIDNLKMDINVLREQMANCEREMHKMRKMMRGKAKTSAPNPRISQVIRDSHLGGAEAGTTRS